MKVNHIISKEYEIDGQTVFKEIKNKSVKLENCGMNTVCTQPMIARTAYLMHGIICNLLYLCLKWYLGEASTRGTWAVGLIHQSKIQEGYELLRCGF